MSSAPPSVEDVLSLQRDAIAALMRSRALGEGDIARALELVTQVAAGLLDVRRASVWRFDAERTRIDCLDLYDAETEEHQRGLVLFERDAPAYFAAALQERCISAHDALHDPRTRAFADDYLVPNGITAMLDAPVRVRGELVGIVCHEHVATPRRWLLHEELLAGTLADFVGMALGAAEYAAQANELRRLRDGLEILVEERTHELEQSRENVRALFETSPVAMILTQVASEAVVMANQRAADMFEVAPESVRGKHAPDFWVDDEAREHLMTLVREKGFFEGYDAELRTRSGRRFWGSISVRAVQFEGEPALLVTIQDITNQKQLEQRLRRLATTDGLTGIFNRRHFFEVAEPMVDLAQRHGRELSVAMIDVDHFKAVNDEHGHAVGDDALRLLARLCKAELRTSDVLARYGGEEFVIVLPETSQEAACAAVERIRAALRITGVPLEGEALHFTVSVGVAQRRSEESLDRLLQRADEALYEAKRGGRDRVQVA